MPPGPNETFVGCVQVRRQFKKRQTSRPKPFVFEVGVMGDGRIIFRAIDISGKTCATTVMNDDQALQLARYLQRAAGQP